MIIPLSDESSFLVSQEGVYSFSMPYEFHIDKIYLMCNTAPLDADIIVDLNVNNLSIMTILPKIEDGDTNSDDGSTNPSFFTGKEKITALTPITIDIDQVGVSGTEGKGLKMMLIGHRSHSLD